MLFNAVRALQVAALYQNITSFLSWDAFVSKLSRLKCRLCNAQYLGSAMEVFQ